MLSKHLLTAATSAVLVLGLTVCGILVVCNFKKEEGLFALQFVVKNDSYSVVFKGQKSYFDRKRIIEGSIADATGNERPELLTDRERSATEHTPPIIIDM